MNLKLFLKKVFKNAFSAPGSVLMKCCVPRLWWVTLLRQVDDKLGGQEVSLPKQYPAFSFLLVMLFC